MMNQTQKMFNYRLITILCMLKSLLLTEIDHNFAKKSNKNHRKGILFLPVLNIWNEMAEEGLNGIDVCRVSIIYFYLFHWISAFSMSDTHILKIGKKNSIEWGKLFVRKTNLKNSVNILWYNFRNFCLP